MYKKLIMLSEIPSVVKSNTIYVVRGESGKEFKIYYTNNDPTTLWEVVNKSEYLYYFDLIINHILSENEKVDKTLRIYKAKRIDEGHDIDWGENQGIVFCCTESQVEMYITKYLLTNQVNQSAQSTIDSRDLTMDDIELTELGIANHQLKEGVILIDNVGA